jgi:hypothetical protein
MTRFWNRNIFNIWYSIESKCRAYKPFNIFVSVDFTIKVVRKVRSLAGWDEWIRSYPCPWNGSSDTMNLPPSKCFPRGSIQIRDAAGDIFPRTWEEQRTDAIAIPLKVVAYLGSSAPSYFWKMKQSGSLVGIDEILKSPHYSTCPAREDIGWPKHNEMSSLISSILNISKSN